MNSWVHWTPAGLCNSLSSNPVVLSASAPNVSEFVSCYRITSSSTPFKNSLLKVAHLFPRPLPSM